MSEMNLEVVNEESCGSNKDIHQLGNMLILQIVLTGSIAVVFTIISQCIGLNAILNNLELEHNITLFGLFIANMATFFIYKKKLQVKTSSLFSQITISYREIIRLAILTIGLMKLLGYFGNYITYKLNIMTNQTIIISDSEFVKRTLLVTLITIFLECIIIPVSEECLFRGIMLQVLKKKGKWFAIITTGVVFSIIHVSTNFFVSFAVGGIVLGYITIKANSIVPAIIIHGIFNFIIRIKLILGDSSIFRQGIDWVFIVMAIIILCLGYKNKKPSIKNINQGATVKARVKELFKTPSLIIVILFYIIAMGISIKR